jgi:hypothetical protein
LFQLPSWLNKLFLRINRIENKLIISGINMPFGSSLFLVECKKEVNLENGLGMISW